MISIDHLASVVQSGGCLVLGIDVTPERYRSLFQDATNQDYLVIGHKDSSDANFIASRMCGDHVESKSLSILDLEVDAYLIRSDKRAG
ncbi:MAG: hypothetical protein KAR65_10390 [Anaerolineales bacterium]|nr:hypothetical protein [Anaerolineales bacterium]